MKAWTLASLSLALHEAIFSGGYDVAAYEGAMNLLVTMAHELGAETRTITDDLFSELQKESAETGRRAAQ